MALSVEIAVFWNVMPCSLVCRCSCLWGICYLQLQGEDRDKFSETSWPVRLLCVTYN